MTRGLELLTLVASLAVSAYLFAGQWGGTGGAGTSVDRNRPIAEASAVAAGVAASQAERELGLYREAHGTYAGATTHVSGLQIVRADATSYCLRIDAGGTPLYDHGPAGAVVTQPC